MSSRGPIWLGYGRNGGRVYLHEESIRPGINLLGEGAEEIAALLAYACNEAGLKTLVLDFNGSVAEKVSGYIPSREVGYFLYDAMRMEERASLHAELAASAYTMALNLSFEQEAFLNSAIQTIALEEGVASPSSLSDQLNLAGEFRGHTADELRGKLGALRSLNVTGETGVVQKMLEGSSVASFSGAESHQAAEVALMILLAKVLSLGSSGVRLPDVLVVNEANRIFSNMPVARHSNRILISLLASPVARILSSEATYGLDHHFIETTPIRILSSSLWNQASEGGRSVGGLYSPQHLPRGRVLDASAALILTPNMFMLQDSSRGYEEAFVPRSFSSVTPETSASTEAATSKAKGEEREEGEEDTSLLKEILEIAANYESSTRGAIISFLSADHPKDEVEKTIDKLQMQGHITVSGTNVRRDSPLHSIRLTQSGKDLLRRLTS